MLVLDKALFEPVDFDIRNGLHESVEADSDSLGLGANELTAMEFNRWAINQNRRIFEWHSRSSRIIFWMSLLITVTGIAFSFWQFVSANQTEKSALEVDELELKSQFISMAFKSRSLASFMMMVSLAYFTIYLMLVYPVRQVRDEVIEKPTAGFTDEDPVGLGLEEGDG